MHKKLTKLLEFNAPAVSHNTKALFDCLLASTVVCTRWTQQFIHDSKVVDKCRKCFVNATLQQLIEGILVRYIRLTQSVNVLRQIHFTPAMKAFCTVWWDGSEAFTATPLRTSLLKYRKQRPVLNASCTSALKEILRQQFCTTFGSRLHCKHCTIVV